MNKRLIYCFLLSLLINEARAEFFDDTPAEKQDTSIEQKRIDLQQRLTDVEKRYGETAAALKNLQAQIDQARRNLGKNQQELVTHQKEIDKYSKELAAQIKSAYAMGEKEKLKIMLNQKDPALSSRMMLYYTYINQARLKKLRELQAATKVQGQLEQQKTDETQNLEKSLRQKQAEQISFNDSKKQRNALLKQLLRDFSSHQQQLNDLKESEEKLKGLLTNLHDEQQTDDQPITPTNGQDDSNFSRLQGQLTWPVNGTVRKFGSARAKGIWEGVLIAADEGTEVRAVAKGKVAYSDPLQGYGSLIILDHGQGYMTVHGFNQSLYKRVGDSVEAGDVIATVGKSGGRKESGLYFAIRKQGMPIDPLSWCVKPNK